MFFKQVYLIKGIDMQTSKKMKFEIYTEDLNREYIESVLNKHFKGYTLSEQIGFWNGHKEASLLITIITIADDDDLIATLCEKIRDYNEQDTVMISVSPVKVAYI